MAKELDIDALYSVDKTKNEDGVVFNYGKAKFRLRHFAKSSLIVQKIMAELTKPYRKLIDAKMLSTEQDRAIGMRCFARASVIDWEDVAFGGTDFGPYSEDKAVELFTKYDALYVDLVSDASDIGRFRADDDTVKN